jgi:xylulokinase
MKYLLGLDIGSSSVKASLLDAESGRVMASAQSPHEEMRISSPRPGFAEQDPDMWWHEMIHAVDDLRRQVDFGQEPLGGIGISYQMHGLVAVDEAGQPVIPSIIWCDGRAVNTGDAAFRALGEEFCLAHYLNSPGNFTASKLSWVREHDAHAYAKIKTIMLPGDYIAFRLTGEMATTVSGLSEGILWDYQAGGPALALLNHYGIGSDKLAPLVPQFGLQGRVTETAARLTGIPAGTPVTYRAGDQPNNAWSLNVLRPGEIAATAGTSGVVYGITASPAFDPASRVNAFVHVNHTPEAPRYGILLCVNGTGILNSWLRREVLEGMDYAEINALAQTVHPGADGLTFYPFGNGAERVLSNADPGASLRGLQFNRHSKAHLARAAQEGIVFALQYGMEIMQEMGLKLETVRAGHTNMFLSPLFADSFAQVSGCQVELYNTDGAQGAARAAGRGAGIYGSDADCFHGMEIIRTYAPDHTRTEAYQALYAIWKEGLAEILRK